VRAAQADKSAAPGTLPFHRFPVSYRRAEPSRACRGVQQNQAEPGFSPRWPFEARVEPAAMFEEHVQAGRVEADHQNC